MTDSKFLDSSAWLSYFYAENIKIKTVVESDDFLLSSALSIFEIKLKMLKDKRQLSEIQQSLDFLKKRSLVLSVSEDVALNAVEISFKHSLHAIDALIYASAIKKNATLITLDNDFRRLDNVVILN